MGKVQREAQGPEGGGASAGNGSHDVPSSLPIQGEELTPGL